MRRQSRADDFRARRAVQGIGLVRNRLREEVVSGIEFQGRVREQERFGEGIRQEGKQVEGRVRGEISG